MDSPGVQESDLAGQCWLEAAATGEIKIAPSPGTAHPVHSATWRSGFRKPRLTNLPSVEIRADLSVTYPSVHLFSMMKCCGYPAGVGYRTTEGADVGMGPMRAFRILEHTADIGFEAFGSTCEETFANAGRALIHLIVDLDAIDPREKVTLQVQGADPGSVLVNWLSELLYLHDAEGWLFRDFEILNLRDDSLSAIARGEKFDRSRHQAKLLVKAVTYHQLALERTPEGWRAQVYVDV